MCVYAGRVYVCELLVVVREYISLMLKSLKKGDKKETKKESNKQVRVVRVQKATKVEGKKQREEQEEETAADLVDINYNEKETTVKTVKKQQTSKLDEKEIDTSNIVIEKKEEKKVITSWVVDESKVKDLLRKDFNMNEHETDFLSINDQAINKQLEEKAKKLAEENKPKVVEQGGFKVAPLQNLDRGREQEMVFSKKQEVSILPTNGIPVKEVVIVNTALNNGAVGNFAPLEKTAQQLKEEQLEAKMRREPELAVKGGKGGWLGSKANEEKQAQAEFKVSAWALQGAQTQGQQPGLFAPLQKTAQEMKLENASRKEQDFKYSSKKEQEERRKAREQQEAAIVKK